MMDGKGKEEKKNSIAIDTGKIESIGEYRCPEDLYRGLIMRVRKYHPSDDISLIEKAYEVARNAHEGQLRKSGEPYIIHPLYVSSILADLELDKETIAAGLLHDVVEDTVLTRQQIEEQFGADVARLVDGVTKLKKLKLSGDYGDRTQVQQEMQARNLRKMFLAMAKDIRVILIKLADRLHNMRTMEFMPLEKQQRISQETLDIYAPIADRLGISKIKVELDDLSLKYLYPDVYFDLVTQVAQRKSERERYVQEIAAQIKEHLKEAGIKGEVDGRVKHFFSIYRKMVNQNKSLEEIYDLFAVRVIVETIRDCYAVLGTIHEMYKPIPGRFKDYIAMPKANMYQSLHTTLIGPSGQPFEIQIRTYEMHKAAEYGIAAHWKYKEAGSSQKVEKTREEEKLTWLRQILEWQQDMSDNREFMDLLKSDLNLFSDDVYCFTPRGEVKNLPAGSTPIDFAYAIHTAVGNRMVGAKVNDKIVNIDYVIRNGDRIEILTSASSKGPSMDWLTIAKSASTRNKINQWFKKENTSAPEAAQTRVSEFHSEKIRFQGLGCPPGRHRTWRDQGRADHEQALRSLSGGSQETALRGRDHLSDPEQPAACPGRPRSRLCDHQGSGRCVDPLFQMLQSGSRRSYRRLYHTGKGSFDPSQRLQQRRQYFPGGSGQAHRGLLDRREHAG